MCFLKIITSLENVYNYVADRSPCLIKHNGLETEQQHQWPARECHRKGFGFLACKKSYPGRFFQMTQRNQIALAERTKPQMHPYH